MDYYSVDKILADEVKIKIKIKSKIHHFGFFIDDLNNDINENLSVDIPLYISLFFLKNKHCILCNDILSEDFKNDLRSNSSIVNLTSVCSYFYNFVSIFYEQEYVNNIFFNRICKFYTLIMKEKLEEEDIFLMDNIEKNIIIRARINYLMYRMYFIKS